MTTDDHLNEDFFMRIINVADKKYGFESFAPKFDICANDRESFLVVMRNTRMGKANLVPGMYMSFTVWAHDYFSVDVFTVWNGSEYKLRFIGEIHKLAEDSFIDNVVLDILLRVI